MYESPINIQELTRDIQQNIKQDQEKKVMECIWEYGIKVDKEELIKALEYDRDQYTKGYNDALDKIRAEIEQIIGERNLDDYDFCSGLICARNIIDKYKAGGDNECMFSDYPDMPYQFDNMTGSMNL